MSRNTVRKVLRRDETAFRYDRQAAAAYPKLGPFQTRLDALLTAPPDPARRERLTLMRIWELLRGDGDPGSNDTVFVARARQFNRRFARLCRAGLRPTRLGSSRPVATTPRARGSDAATHCTLFAAPGMGDFRLFLERHSAMLRALPAWTLRIVAPPEFPGIGDRATKVVEEQLMQPMRAVTIDDMRWFFAQLRASSADDVEHFRRCRVAFSLPHSQVICRLWKQDGEAALVSIGSPAIREAVEAGRGRIERSLLSPCLPSSACPRSAHSCR